METSEIFIPYIILGIIILLGWVFVMIKMFKRLQNSQMFQLHKKISQHGIKKEDLAHILELKKKYDQEMIEIQKTAGTTAPTLDPVNYILQHATRSLTKEKIKIVLEEVEKIQNQIKTNPWGIK